MLLVGYHSSQATFRFGESWYRAEREPARGDVAASESPQVYLYILLPLTNLLPGIIELIFVYQMKEDIYERLGLVYLGHR